MKAVGRERLHIGPRDHVVQFYADDRDLVQSVGGYLLDAIEDDGLTIVIASPEHRRAFQAWLAGAGVDLASARARGAYHDLDARETMARFMIDGEPDDARFEQTISGLIQSAVASGRPVRAYGEMVALLWDSGLVGAAIELEARWNELARKHPFSLLCGYPAELVGGSGHFQAFNEVCLQHGGVVGDGLAAQTRAFALTSDAPASARHFAVEAVGRLGAADLAEDAALIVTELTANAALHAGSGFTVTLSSGRGVVRISVRDECRLPEADSLRAEPMHGLGRVAALSSDWGVTPCREGKTVWAELASPR